MRVNNGHIQQAASNTWCQLYATEAHKRRKSKEELYVAEERIRNRVPWIGHQESFPPPSSRSNTVSTSFAQESELLSRRNLGANPYSSPVVSNSPMVLPPFQCGITQFRIPPRVFPALLRYVSLLRIRWGSLDVDLVFTRMSNQKPIASTFFPLYSCNLSNTFGSLVSICTFV